MEHPLRMENIIMSMVGVRLASTVQYDPALIIRLFIAVLLIIASDYYLDRYFAGLLYFSLTL